METKTDLTRDELFDLVKTNVNINKLVFGSAIAFEPYQYETNTKLFTPYAYQSQDSVCGYGYW